MFFQTSSLHRTGHGGSFVGCLLPLPVHDVLKVYGFVEGPLTSLKPTSKAPNIQWFSMSVWGRSTIFVLDLPEMLGKSLKRILSNGGERLVIGDFPCYSP